VLTAEQRLQIATLLRRHPTWGLPRVRRAIPGLPKNATAAYLRRGKAILRRRRRRNGCRLTWLRPGVVWAIDGTWLDRPVDGCGRRALLVVDVASRNVLAFEAVAGERAGAAVDLLRRLVGRHGAPLVLKSDNGSAFVAKVAVDFCRRHGITQMHSPVRRPRWNGTCEVSGRWAKRRAAAAAIARGSVALAKCDLDAAVTAVVEPVRVGSEERTSFLGTVREQLAVVAAERGLAVDGCLPDHLLRTLGRVAAQRALQLCHILTIEGRAYRQWLPSPAA
jgi:hypothetical protein